MLTASLFFSKMYFLLLWHQTPVACLLSDEWRKSLRDLTCFNTAYQLPWEASLPASAMMQFCPHSQSYCACIAALICTPIHPAPSTMLQGAFLELHLSSHPARVQMHIAVSGVWINSGYPLFLAQEFPKKSAHPLLDLCAWSCSKLMCSSLLICPNQDKIELPT